MKKRNLLINDTLEAAACNPRGVTYSQHAYWKARVSDLEGRLIEVEALIESLQIITLRTTTPDTVNVLIGVTAEKCAALRKELFREEMKRTA